MPQSLCPICMKRLPATHRKENETVYLEKTCVDHGFFSTVIWRGDENTKFSDWERNHQSKLNHVDSEVKYGCPFDCGICGAHLQNTCCTLVEITKRCNQKCRVCFAENASTPEDPSIEELRKRFQKLLSKDRTYLQLSGGEPTVRNDIVQIVQMAHEMGFDYIQLNTNGLELGLNSDLANELKIAGLSAVFMQFDSVDPSVHKMIRGETSYDSKLRAIENCAKCHLGVVLVQTVIPNVNDGHLGDIIKFAVSKSPAVRGVHFQPVTYTGKYPVTPSNEMRLTLPEVMKKIVNQMGGSVKIDDFTPASAYHSRCSFNASYVISEDKRLKKLNVNKEKCQCCDTQIIDFAVEKNRQFVTNKWEINSHLEIKTPYGETFGEWDHHLKKIKTNGFSITGMAFQDCWNVEIDRLKSCSLHVMKSDGSVMPFCAYYMTDQNGNRLY